MSNLIPTHFFALVLFRLAMLTAFGEVAEVTVRIHAPPVRGILTQDSQWSSIPGQVWVVDGENTWPVQLQRNGYSRPFRVRASEPLFLAGSPGGSPDESPDAAAHDQKPLLLATLPESASNVIITLFPGEVDDAGLMKYEILDFSPESVPNGSHVFQNLLENPLELTVGAQTHFLEPAQTITLELLEPRNRIFIQEIDGARGRRFTGAVYGNKDIGVRHLVRPHPQSARRIDLGTFYRTEMDEIDEMPADAAGAQPENAQEAEVPEADAGTDPVNN